jgi:hypothetical protein
MTTPSHEVEVFRAELRELYVAAGKPSPQAMAQASGRPPGLFAFLNAPGLPAWDQVTALLTATGNHAPATVVRWRRRWARLDKQPRRPAPDGRSAPGSAARLREPGGDHQTGPVNQALAASNPAEFAGALNQLRLAAGMSFGEIARRKKGILSKSAAHRMATAEDTLPLRREALAAFVRACGGTEEDALAWWAVAARIRRGDPPVARSREIPAAGLLLQHPRPPEPWLPLHDD